MTSEEKELISTIKIAVIRGIVFADEEKLLELIKTAVGSNMSEKPTGSTTKNDLGVDCISRNTVLTLINDVKNANGFSDYSQYEYLFDQVDKMPPVTPQEPKTGKWISHREHCEMNNLRPSGLGSYFWCSECDCGIDSKNFSRVNYNYCPNCGAKMVESEEE